MSNLIKVGCEVFLIKNDSVLLGKRKNCYGDGTWGLPGGHLEYGESIVDCAKRELQEELGIECIDLKIISIVDNIDERGHYLHISFLAESFFGEIRCMEPQFCEEWKFFNLKNLPIDLFKPHQKIFKNYFNHSLYLENK